MYQIKFNTLFVVIIFIFFSLFAASGSFKENNVLAVANTVSFNSIADTYVNSDSPTKNYGSGTSLYVDGSPNSAHSYLKFDLSSLNNSNIVSAKLILFTTTNANANTNGVNNIVLIPDNSWQENTLTFSNKPAFGPEVGTIQNKTINTQYVVPLNPSVIQPVAGSLLSLAINTSSGDGSYFYSKESVEQQRPVLIIEYETQSVTPTGTATPLPPTPTVVPTTAPTSTPLPPTSTPMPTVSPTASGSTVTVVAAGDISCDSLASTSTTCQQRQTSDLAIAVQPDKVLALGDLQYPSGTLSRFKSFYDLSWGRLKAITSPVIGNHESPTNGYYDYFNGVGMADGPAGNRSKGYYSYDIGSWHVVALNSNCASVPGGGCAIGSEQEQWLRNDLALHPNKCTLAYWHHPYYTTGSRGPTSEVKPLVSALYDAGTDILLVGHMHFYERFAPQDPDYKLDTIKGIRSFTVGTGGKEILNLGNKVFPNLDVRSTNSFGVLKLTLNPDSYSWQFIPVPGHTFTDTGTESCR